MNNNTDKHPIQSEHDSFQKKKQLSSVSIKRKKIEFHE